VHVPLQHWAPLVQAWLSEMHCVLPQCPPSQTRVQHSVGAAQLSPPALQLPTGFAHAFRRGSQFAEQQSPCDAQVEPTGSQLVGPSTLASRPAPGAASSSPPQPWKSAGISARPTASESRAA